MDAVNREKALRLSNEIMEKMKELQQHVRTHGITTSAKLIDRKMDQRIALMDEVDMDINYRL